MKNIYFQCTLKRHDSFGCVEECVADVADIKARVGEEIRYREFTWTITHVGPKCEGQTTQRKD